MSALLATDGHSSIQHCKDVSVCSVVVRKTEGVVNGTRDRYFSSRGLLIFLHHDDHVGQVQSLIIPMLDHGL